MRMSMLSMFLVIPFTINLHKHKHPDVKTPHIQQKEIYQGVDVSKYQGRINWDKVDSIDFVICKKSEGLTLEDIMYEYNINNIKCLKGVYHFFRPQFSGIEQGKLFLRGLDTVQLDIVPVIDVEYTKWWTSSTKELGTKRLKDMIGYVEDKYGKRPIIYTSPRFWNQYVCDGMDSLNLKLWVADWRDNQTPEIPCGFNEWTIWQKTSSGSVVGIDGRVDVNITKNIDSVLTY